MFFFLITAAFFGAFGFVFSTMNPFFEFYKTIAGFALLAAPVCLVLWLIVTLFWPDSLFQPGYSILHDSEFLDGLFCRIPHFRLALLSLVISLSLFWIHSLVFPIGFTAFLASFEMLIARLLFFTCGSSWKR